MSRRHFFYLIAACVLFFFVYSPARLYFLSDDFDSLLFSIKPANILHSFRPLSDASLYIDYSVWKMNAAGFHATNLFLHFLCVFSFYFFSNSIFLLRNEAAVSAKMALGGSLLFLFYPYHSEALFWIVGRGAVLCTLFALLSFIFYVERNRSRLFYWLSLACFAASLLSYEEAWIVPVLITTIAIFTDEKSKKKSVLQAGGFWLLFVIYLAGRFYFTQDIIGTPYGSERITSFTFFTLCKNFAALIFRSVVVPMQSSVAFSITCAFVTILIGILLFINRKKINLVLPVSAACFLLSLFPVLPLGIDTHDTESERFLYFPSLFLCIFFVQLFSIVLAKKSWLAYTLLIAESITLRQSYNSFVLSSIVCRTTTSALAKTVAADTIFCRQLPGQYKGAFIFRNGFESAVKLVKKTSTQPVFILSHSELFHPEKDYKSEFADSFFRQEKKNIYIEWKEDKVVFTK